MNTFKQYTNGFLVAVSLTVVLLTTITVTYTIFEHITTSHR